jgi:hypothetical protein
LAEPTEFLARWSRLKRLARAESGRRPAIAEPAAAPITPAVPSGSTASNASPLAAQPAPELPAVETLGKDSDYTAFMRSDVPDALRNQALRKLWGSDPVFANLDGLVEYGEDYGEAFRLGGAVATAYRVLKGMPCPEDECSAAEGKASAEELPSAHDAAADTSAALASADHDAVTNLDFHPSGRAGDD